jgi:hypothetical protein
MLLFRFNVAHAALRCRFSPYSTSSSFRTCSIKRCVPLAFCSPAMWLLWLLWLLLLLLLLLLLPVSMLWLT